MSAENFDSRQETIYLLWSPANARRIMEAAARDKPGQSAASQTRQDKTCTLRPTVLQASPYQRFAFKPASDAPHTRQPIISREG
jgi:hypothetical protein